MHNKLTLTLVTLAALLAAGCAAVVQPEYYKPEATVKPGKYLYLSISAAPYLEMNKDYTDSMIVFISELKQKFTTSFPDTVLVDAAPPPGTTAGDLLKITVMDFRYVSGSARIWGGSLAGHAAIQVYVVITDLKDGKQLDVASLGTSSSYGQGVFGTVTSKQLDSLSTAIVGMFSGAAPGPAAQ